MTTNDASNSAQDTFSKLRAQDTLDQMVGAINFPPEGTERPSRYLGDLMRDAFIIGRHGWHTFAWIWTADGSHLCADREHLLSVLDTFTPTAIFVCDHGDLYKAAAGNALAVLDCYRRELQGKPADHPYDHLSIGERIELVRRLAVYAAQEHDSHLAAMVKEAQAGDPDIQVDCLMMAIELEQSDSLPALATARRAPNLVEFYIFIRVVCALVGVDTREACEQIAKQGGF